MLIRANQSRRKPQRRRGASIVEFAIVVPLLFAMLLGIVEFGRMFMVAQVTTNGSREGARYAVQGDKDRTVKNASDYTKKYLETTGIPNSAVKTVTVSYLNSGGTWTAMADTDLMSSVSASTPIKMYVEVDFSQVTWLPSGIFVSSGTAVPGTTVMRKE